MPLIVYRPHTSLYAHHNFPSSFLSMPVILNFGGDFLPRLGEAENP